MRVMLMIHQLRAEHASLYILLKYTVLFTMLLLSVASLSLNSILSKQANPFFYATF